MKKFFALDRKNPNGQVEWAEWLADFESRYDDEQKSTRLYKASLSQPRLVHSLTRHMIGHLIVQLLILFDFEFGCSKVVSSFTTRCPTENYFM